MDHQIFEGTSPRFATDPLLFNIYKANLHNFFPENIKILQYADDITILVKGNNIETIIDDLNENLSTFNKW